MRAARAYTLVEVLVTISIIGILVALLLPAVQATRESARRAQCTANLKQIAFATLHYHDTWAKLPLGEMPGSLSPNVAILPYLEQTALYASFNFAVINASGLGVGGTTPTWMFPAASTAASTRVAVFTCPSEINISTNPQRPSFWASNYAWNSGTWWLRGRSWDGLFGRSVREGTANDPAPPDPPLGALSLSSCVDGLSATLLLAEVAAGPRAELAGRTPVSDCFVVPDLNIGMKPQVASAACEEIDWRSGEIPWKGRWRHKGFPWVEGTLWRGWFNTLSPPNRPCCVRGSSGVTGADWWYMIKPASSYHPGQVNAANADGSVHTYRDTIDRSIWMSLSTRSGGEAISADAY